MLHRTILHADWAEPLAVLAGFADEPWAVTLLSDGKAARGRWSYAARRPEFTRILLPDDSEDPFTSITDLLGTTDAAPDGGPPFQGGVIGLASYELGARVEGLALGRTSWPDLACARYPGVLAFDHQERRVLAIGRGSTQARADERAAEVLSWLDAAGLPPSPTGPLSTDFTSDDEGQAYEAAVAEVVARIADGEIFQANIARRWRGGLVPGATPYDLFMRLARTSPAPFAAYLRLADRALVSNSPERFVQVSPRGQVETRPIKGTAPRGVTAEADRALASALAASPKDRAENLMIVDLMRNDLARVCVPGRVRTPDLFALETFANVHHLVSTVTGQLAADRTAVDLLRAAFPPGSVTGAPKVQAMKVIAGLEPPRGPYCGAMFWAGFDGGFDSSVLIRTAALECCGQGWTVEARAGAGIVADSDPVLERRETEAKISAMVAALKGEGA